jgi:hypothetical protein
MEVQAPEHGLPWIGIPPLLDRGREGSGPFGPLQCRGFSYAFSASPVFRMPLPRRVNLRFALHLPSALSHPPAVVRALRVNRCRHVISARGRCAAFALGTSRREPQGAAWYVYALQSDLALLGRPVLRDYLRGWRKVLLACVLNAAEAAGARAVHLAPAAAAFDVARTNPTYATMQLPDLWRQIYDRTAREFGMGLVDIEAPVNIQMMPHRRPHAWRTFYRLLVREAAASGG